MNDIAIRCEGLGKKYRIGERESYKALRDTITDTLSAPFRRLRAARNGAQSAPTNGHNTFWALKDVSFEIKRGEVVGIIGRNGAGKSTLLKILSRITAPTAGKVEIRGRVGSLLEVGTGFHPELTGRENIYLNGAILGMKKTEIERKFDDIVAFAEIEKFIDTPVKRYSSGMYVRLAFGVAAHLEPEILVIDEVLAVGDFEFQKKCLGKMQDVGKAGRTVLFVSHNMSAIRQLCTFAMLLNDGSVMQHGVVDECTSAYMSSQSLESGRILDHAIRKSESLTIDSITINGTHEDKLKLLPNTTSLEVNVNCYINNPTRVSLEGRLLDTHGNVIGSYSPPYFNGDVQRLPVGHAQLKGIIELPKLTKGDYFIDLYITDPGVEGLWEFPYALHISADGWPSINGFIFENRLGKGAIILSGNLTYIH